MPYTCTMWSTRYGRRLWVDVCECSHKQHTHTSAHCNNVAPQKFSLDLPSSTSTTPSGFLTEKSLSWKMNGKSREKKLRQLREYAHTNTSARCSLHTRLRNECFVLFLCVCLCIIYHSNWFSQTKRVYTQKENICCELHRSHRSHQKCRVISVHRTCVCLWVCFSAKYLPADRTAQTRFYIRAIKFKKKWLVLFGRRFYSWIIKICTNCRALN